VVLGLGLGGAADAPPPMPRGEKMNLGGGKD
jgi:hypothetical protein